MTRSFGCRREPQSICRGKRLSPLLMIFCATALGLTLTDIAPASATTLSVCRYGCPYTQIAPAVAAANSGDTIRIGPGTYVGGVSIDNNLQLIGEGPGATTIKGGGGSV